MNNDKERKETKMKKNKLYFACSWFTPEEAKLMNEAIEEVKKNPTVSWDDSYFALDAGNQYKGLSVEEHPELTRDHEWIEHTLANDNIGEISCDVALFIWDSEHPDTGMAWEMGAAWALHKPIVFVTRKSSNELKINLMLASADDYITLDQLATYDFNHIHKKYWDGEVF